MKAFLVLLLLAVASCNTEIQEPELEFDVSGLIKCITEVAPLVPDVIEIINLIKAADWAQVAVKAVELVSKGIPAVKECIAAFKKEVKLEAGNLEASIRCLGQCKHLPQEPRKRCVADCLRCLKN
jgi:hypothetical protein